MTTEPETTVRGPMGGDQRLELIMNTAEQMFFEKGYRGVSIRDLAAAVGIQMSSLYYYFPSKDEILYRIIKRHMEELILRMERALSELDPAATNAQKLRKLIRESVIYLIGDRLAAGISTTQGRELPRDQTVELTLILKRYEALYLRIISEGMESGEFVRTDVALAAYVILGAQVRLSAWFHPGGRLTPEDIAETYGFLLVRGLLTDPASLVE